MIVVGGEALVDLVIGPSGQVAAALGGGPFNSARAIGRLGTEVEFLGALSRDRFGTLLLGQLRDDQVGVRLTQFTDLPTTLAAAELDEGGAATYHFYFSDTSAPTLSSAALPEATRILHVGTLGLVLEPMASVLEHVVMSAGDEVLVMLDPNCRPRVTPNRAAYLGRLDRLLGRADVVKVSTDDLEFLSPGDLDAGVRLLLDGGATVVLHTDGGRGIAIRTSAGTVHVPVPTVDVVDTIGAGDSFGGAFAAWWHQAGLGRDDLSDVDALRSAVAAAAGVAAISCTRVGAQPPRRDELGGSWAPTM